MSRVSLESKEKLRKGVISYRGVEIEETPVPVRKRTMAEGKLSELNYRVAKSSGESDEASGGMKGDLSRAAIIVGVICLLPVIYIAIADHLIGIVPVMMSIDPLTVPGLTTFGPLFILAVIVRPISRILKVKGFLSRKDLVVIYVMTYVSTATAMTLASTVVTSLMGLHERALYFVPHILGSLPEHFSSLILPKGEGVVEGFWRGDSTVPWGAWIMPAIMWSLYLLALTLIGILLVSLVRKQWDEREHLTYPMNKPVMVLAGDPGEEEAVRAFWKDKLMWCGFAITALYMLYEFLAGQFPVLPTPPDRISTVPRTLYSIAQGFGPDVARAFNTTDTQVWIVFWIFGLGYFVGSNVLFSVFFFWLFRKLLHYIFIKTGVFMWWSTMKKVSYMVNFDLSVGTGAAVTMAVMLLWLARHDIKAIFSKAFGDEKEGTTSADELNYRLIVFGGIIALLFVILFELLLLHKSVFQMLVRLPIWLLVMVGASRIRVEAGAPVLGLPLDFSYAWLFPGLGSKALGGTVGAAGNIMTYHMDLQQYAPIVGIWTSVLEGYNMADEARLKRSSINKSVILSVVITGIIFFAMGLPLVYRGKGAVFIMPGSSPKTHLGQAWNPVRDIASNRIDLYPPGPQLWPWVPMMIGAALSYFIFFMSIRYAWWPFNVAGYIIANTQPFDRPMVIALSCAWIVKSLVFRYGGRKLYRRLMPFFLGFALGELTVNFIRPFLQLIFFA